MAIKKVTSLKQYQGLAKSYKEQEFEPLYLIFGEERYFIDELLQLATTYAIDEDLRDFNYTLLYGDEADASEAIALCLTVPMMSERRLIIIRRFDQMPDKRKWAAYAKRPNPHAVVLLVCQRRPDFRSAPYNVLNSRAEVWEFESLKRRQIAAFIRQHVKHSGGTIDQEAVACLEDYIGTSLSAIVGEIKKLKTFAGDRTHLTRDDVVLAIGQSREANVWELRDAVLTGRLADSERITALLLGRSANRSGEAIRIVALLGSFITNVWWAQGLLRKGCRQEEIAEIMKIRKGSAFVVRQYVDAARRLRPGELHQAFSTLLAADCELKGESPRDARLILTLMMQKMFTAAAHQNRGTRGYRD